MILLSIIMASGTEFLTVPGKAQQRDIAVPAFGYKNHASIDRRHGFIRGWNVTSACSTIGIVRARAKIGMANLAYNLTRFVWRQGRTAPA